MEIMTSVWKCGRSLALTSFFTFCYIDGFYHCRLHKQKSPYPFFFFQIVQSVQRLATGWTVRELNPGEGEIFRTHPDRPCGPPSLVYSGYRVCFPGAKRLGRGLNHPPPSNAEVKERIELYLYSPSGPSWR